jgi:hypothetical protein
MLGEEDFYIKTNFTWEKEKRGFLDQLSRYPDSRQWNVFAHFALMQRDREATAKAMPHIENSVELSVWKYQSLYEQVRQWAIEDAPYPLSIDLVDAVEDNNLSAVTQLLEKGASPLVYTEYKSPILTTVIDNDNLPIFRALVEAGADVHGLDRHSNPLTHYAVRNADAEFLRLILEAGADPNAREPAGNTPMSIAIKNGNPQSVPLLIEYGADLNLTVGPSRYAPSHHAAKYRGPKLIQVLIDLGADVNMKMIDDWTPLMLAANNGKMGATRVLLENGADPTAIRGESRTAKDMAKEEGYMDVVKLIEKYEKK